MYLYLWCRLQLRQGNLSHRGAPIRRLLVRLLRTTDVGMRQYLPQLALQLIVRR